MKIAVVNEISTAARHQAVMEALRDCGHEVVNAGMTAPGDLPALTYLHTGLISALLLNLHAVDMVIGGCGTGEGYLNSALQYPGVSCVLITEPLDGWLSRRINDPNCISLALNKGFGWAGEENLRLILASLLAPADAPGYPPARAESQTESRRMLRRISEAAHPAMVDILPRLDASITGPVYQCRTLRELAEAAPPSALRSYLLEVTKGQ